MEDSQEIRLQALEAEFKKEARFGQLIRDCKLLIFIEQSECGYRLQADVARTPLLHQPLALAPNLLIKFDPFRKVRTKDIRDQIMWLVESLLCLSTEKWFCQSEEVKQFSPAQNVSLLRYIFYGIPPATNAGYDTSKVSYWLDNGRLPNGKKAEAFKDWSKLLAHSLHLTADLKVDVPEDFCIEYRSALPLLSNLEISKLEQIWSDISSNAIYTKSKETGHFKIAWFLIFCQIGGTINPLVWRLLGTWTHSQAANDYKDLLYSFIRESASHDDIYVSLYGILSLHYLETNNNSKEGATKCLIHSDQVLDLIDREILVEPDILLHTIASLRQARGASASQPASSYTLTTFFPHKKCSFDYPLFQYFLTRLHEGLDHTKAKADHQIRKDNLRDNPNQSYFETESIEDRPRLWKSVYTFLCL
ncbi:MAG: hypothetical protein M1814_003914 [Vezdaea aestivalis]|nr:MAG: hypothetical protein M1814_003914 [Vezdaea aestivalis]